VPEGRIAKALNVDVQNIVRKRRLLEDICPEIADILKDKHIAINIFIELKKMLPLRQIEAHHLDLVLTNGYIAKLLSNARVVRYLAQHHRTF